MRCSVLPTAAIPVFSSITSIFYQQRSRGDRAAARLFLPFPVIRKGESSEDGTSVLGAVGSVIAELFAVPEVLLT